MLPNDRRVAQIERQISDIDSLRVDLITSKLLQGITNETVTIRTREEDRFSLYARYQNLGESNRVQLTQYQKARDIARRIILNENRSLGSNVDLSMAEKSQISSNIKNLYEEAESIFGVIDKDNDYLSLLNDELESLLQLRNGLASIKGLVASSFHEKVAARLKRSNRNSLQGSDTTYLFTLDLMNKTRRDLDQINRKYDYALLDILFQENVRRDREYRFLIQQLEDEENR